MIYCDKKKIIFIHLVKTGGSSIKDAFSMPWGKHMMVKELFDNSLAGNKKILEGDERHFCSIKEIERFKEQVRLRWDSYYKFSFVRNPWDRVISEIFFNIKRGRCESREIKRMILDKCKGPAENVWKKNYIEWLLGPSGGIDLDFIGRFENLQLDINTICDNIELRRRGLPHLNESAHGHYSSYYDQETRDAVAKSYAEDIEHFGYKFGS